MSAQQHGREMLRMLRSAPALSSGRVVDSVGMHRPSGCGRFGGVEPAGALHQTRGPISGAR